MPSRENRVQARFEAMNRKFRVIDYPLDSKGDQLNVSDFYGENVFDISTTKEIPDDVRKELLDVARSGKRLDKNHADIVANSVTKWATDRGATHFCHWFQPLTGSSAEKHDAFLTIKNGRPIERLSVSQLLQGEPDASSLPHGGSRSTFEARGYTTWDLTSPMFLVEGPNGKTLCIPTAYVSYEGHALDMKTPLLRSISALSEEATKFLKLIGRTEADHVGVTIGCEQEYFLVDKAFYYSRPDLVMTGRTMMGSSAVKNQQLEDHYFGVIPDRVMAFMQELDYELYRLGIPAKTRHNEVAPGQYEIAPIFSDANVAADNNQLLMAMIRKVAERHDFVALMHEKPYQGINGSGKHVNWSLADNTGFNLLEPGQQDPHQNTVFLAAVAMVVEAVRRHSGALRMAIASHSNDHRLGANEAPPSIISVFLGSTLEKILESIKDGKKVDSSEGSTLMEINAKQLADLMKDNTDRNRTSPFAFTGNKFEFRAVGSSAAIGFPVSILNAAVLDVFKDTNAYLEAEIQKGVAPEQALLQITEKWVKDSFHVIFNGDGYSQEWVEEAEKRGLPNYKTTADALKVFKDEKQMAFLLESKVYNKAELDMRYNVLVERYVKHREIEFKILNNLVNQNVIPAVLDYKKSLFDVMTQQKSLKIETAIEGEVVKTINLALRDLYEIYTRYQTCIEQELGKEPEDVIDFIASEFLPLSEGLAEVCNRIEDLIPNRYWSLPKYHEMLFIK